LSIDFVYRFSNVAEPWVGLLTFKSYDLWRKLSNFEVGLSFY